MKNWYEPKYFTLPELVPEAVYRAHEFETWRLWVCFDPLLLVSADRLRERYGPATVNNWHLGGEMQYRGFRPFGCGVGEPWGLHYWFRALDMTFADFTAEEIREHMRRSPGDHDFEFINRVEDGVSWVHIDRGNISPATRAKSGVYFFGGGK